MPVLSDEDFGWSHEYTQVEFVVDNQTLASLANHKSRITNQFYRDIIQTIWRNLKLIYRDGVCSKTRCHDPVRWRRRVWNTGADAAANVALKHGGTKNLNAEALELLKQGDYNGLQVHVDGGYSEGSAACGVTFTTWQVSGTNWTRSLAGFAFAAFQGKSAFHAECRALVAATDMVQKISAAWKR